MPSTRFYLTNIAATYTPATLRGAWDDTAGSVTKALQLTRPYGGATTTVARAETNGSANFDVLLYRGVSAALAGQTITGNVNLCLGALESSTSADFAYHLHVYVTQGNSDTPRGTLLTDYVETTGNEWPTTIAGKSLTGAQALGSLAITAGDRLVIEVGYVALNASASSFTGTLRYGTVDASNIPMTADLTAADTAVTTHAPWIEIDTAVTEDTTTKARVTQFGQVVTGTPNPKARLTQFGALIITTSEVQAKVTQFGVVAIVKEPEVEFEPATTFGPILWAEITLPDGTVQAVAPVDLPDPSTYYQGYKRGTLLTAPRIVRALSDEEGQYESQHFSIELDDTSRFYRELLGDVDTLLLYNKKIVVRMIDEPSWRLRMTPRTVAIGLVRNYQAT